MYIKN